MLNIFRKKGKKNQADNVDTPHATFRRKYASFRLLLTENNTVLELMADIEEKCSGDYLFDMNYIRPRVEEISRRTRDIVVHLNDLSSGKYLSLYDAHETIQKHIDTVLQRRLEIPAAPYVLPLDSIDGSMTLIVGGKMAHLGEIKSRLNLPVPDGFVITSSSFKRFVEYNDLKEKLLAALAGINLRDIKDLEQRSREFREIIVGSALPPDVESAIMSACSELWQRLGGEEPVSVRSSAISEDGEFSFAGQYASFLQVKPTHITQKYAEVIASLFTPRALLYAATKGFSDEDMVMAVGVMRMVHARSGGVLYTRDPTDHYPDVMLISGAWGLAQLVVEGSGKSDRFLVSRTSGAIVDRHIAEKTTRLVSSDDEGVRGGVMEPSESRSPCLTDSQIDALTCYGAMLEKHFGGPQDMEWSVDEDGRVAILQSRRLRIVIEPVKAKSIPRRFDNYPLLIERGVIASKGVGFGTVYMVDDEADLAGFPEGAVLVSRKTSTRYAAVMDKVSAIITDVGGATGHMASLAREYRIPAILDTDIATQVLRQGQEITVDAINCNVYAGKVHELIEYSQRKKEEIRATPLFTTVDRMLKYVVSLHLTDPDSANFKPEACTSLHDITRFAHEKAMAEMFGISDTDAMEHERTVTLSAGIPVEAHLIDVGGGMREIVAESATVDDILSTPFSAFLRGMTSMKWPEPRAADVKGFLGMMAHAASIPEEQLHQTAVRSFAILSEHYMSFSIRLGYHFSMVEAFAGDVLNDNYIKFFFKGGGAARDRRLRRIRLITEILKKMDFKVKVVEDVIDAVLIKFKRGSIEQRLEAMGRLTAYTKQLDMAMYNDDITDWYRDEFVRDYLANLS